MGIPLIPHPTAAHVIFVLFFCHSANVLFRSVAVCINHIERNISRKRILH